MRLMIVAPGHPDLGGGGAERAAYALFDRCRRDPRIESATFVARAEAGAVGHAAPMGCFRGRQDEILVATPGIDRFTGQTTGEDALGECVAALRRHARPDLVHLHHLFGWGVEAADHFKRDGARLVFTAHEFMLICAHDGQMLKTSGAPCHASSPAECAACLPDRAPGKHFLRRQILARTARAFDRVVAPSAMVARRLAEWDERLDAAVIDNVIDAPADEPGPAEPARAVSGRGTAPRTVVGYFGQVTPYKGVDLLLEACHALPEDVRERLDVRLYASIGPYEGHPIHRRIEALREGVPCASWLGGYDNRRVLALMRACDYVVVPSLWWENSPLVIREARLAGCRLLLADHGGLREKADPDRDVTFLPRSAASLAEALATIARTRRPSADRAAHAAAYRGAIEADFEAHMALYAALMR